MTFVGRNLILAIGRSRSPGESLKAYLRRISQEVGIGFRTAEVAWRGSYLSKKTEKKLDAAAKERTQNEIRRLIEDTVEQIFLWQQTDAGRYLAHIDAARSYIVFLRAYADALDAHVPPSDEDCGS